MTNEISLVFLFKILKSSWWKILIITLVVMLLVAAVTEFAIDKQYSSSTEFYIINSSVTSEYTTSALLSAVEYLANDYIEIILGDRMIDQIIQDLTAKGYTGCTPSNVRAMISPKTSAESSIFQITVTHTDKNVAYYVSESIKENAPKIIREISRPSYVSNMYRKETVKNENGETVDKYVLITEADLEWEREQVTLQIEKGDYSFSDDVDVFSMPRCWKFENLGKASITHDAENGFVIKGRYNGEDYLIHRSPLQTNSLHIEYDWYRVRRDDCIDVSTENDSFYCYFKTKKNVVTKLAFATEAIYQKHLADKRPTSKDAVMAKM